MDIDRGFFAFEDQAGVEAAFAGVDMEFGEASVAFDAAGDEGFRGGGGEAVFDFPEHWRGMVV